MTHDPEFCKRVAEAIGLEAEIRTHPAFGKPFCVVRDDQGLLTRRFRPDVDWNDAMWAAERVGLWECESGFRHLTYSPDWHIGEHKGGYAILEPYFARPAPDEEVRYRSIACNIGPRAICEAILKLKGEE